MNDWDDIDDEKIDENTRKIYHALLEGHPNDHSLSDDEKRRNRDLVDRTSEKFEKYFRELEEANTVLERFGALLTIHSFCRDTDELFHKKVGLSMARVYEIVFGDEWASGPF